MGRTSLSFLLCPAHKQPWQQRAALWKKHFRVTLRCASRYTYLLVAALLLPGEPQNGSEAWLRHRSWKPEWFYFVFSQPASHPSPDDQGTGQHNSYWPLLIALCRTEPPSPSSHQWPLGSGMLLTTIPIWRRLTPSLPRLPGPSFSESQVCWASKNFF